MVFRGRRRAGKSRFTHLNHYSRPEYGVCDGSFHSNTWQVWTEKHNPEKWERNRHRGQAHKTVVAAQQSVTISTMRHPVFIAPVITVTKLGRELA